MFETRRPTWRDQRPTVNASSVATLSAFGAIGVGDTTVVLAVLRRRRK